MDYQDEQKQELEVLESIYPDELEILSETHFTIRIGLDTQTDRRHGLLLDVRFPETYPEVVPKLGIEYLEEEDEEEVYDLDEDDDGDEKFVSLAETMIFEKPDFATLLSKLDEEAELNVGMPSIFAIAAILKDEAEILFQNKVDNAQKAYDEELLAKEKEEQKKFHGTEVTKESFSNWRKSFRQEMNIDKLIKERFEKMHNGKMTGREIFEKGLAGEADDDFPELAESTAKLEI
ncbi:hypothetical protein PUMCH_000396 [Australozyma saopauloensis]|uniref:RWD domain-containing protein n=1 Tax=Australozyma saopauloensis TaxID=291208 RepID=A0AAX4H4P1_9ASCO|nr:hypothetical protein PUMCH_000396 [[Candida] saopauloensis]